MLGCKRLAGSPKTSGGQASNHGTVHRENALHALADPDDKVWPHRAIRDGLETWKSQEIERGIIIGKLNSRGVTKRAPLDGGKQERALAGSLREDASKVNAWPRTKLMLIGLAEHWEHSAEREDQHVEEMRLRE